MHEVRLSEVVASLSLATDLGLGLPQEHVLRQTLIASRLAQHAGLTPQERAGVLYVSLLAWVGCVADSHELARWFGDDLEMRRDSYGVDRTPLPMMRYMLSRLDSAHAQRGRLSMVGGFLVAGAREMTGTFATHCQTTADIAERLGIDPEVRAALAQVFERWDGRGTPMGLRGDKVSRMTRVVQIADDAEVFHRSGDIDEAVQRLRAGAGHEFEPALVELVVANAPELFADLDEDAWARVVERCTELDHVVAEEHLDATLAVLADFADLKSPWWLGHSKAVGELAGRAATLAGWPVADIAFVRRAGVVHRLGAVGVSTGVWDKVEPLSANEAERVRQVPYLTRRVLARQPALAPLGVLAGQVRERLDGSGYPAGVGGDALSGPARLLAAAQCYQSLAEERPHRRALAAEDCRAQLDNEVRAGRLDADAVQHVLGAAGHRPRRTRARPAGMTAREAEVLALLARGLPNRAIAERLSITPSTVGSHIEHVYAKTGVSTRGAAAMYALRHGIVDPGADLE